MAAIGQIQHPLPGVQHQLNQNQPSSWLTRIKVERFVQRALAYLVQWSGYLIAGAVFGGAIRWYYIAGVLVTAIVSAKIYADAVNKIDGGDHIELYMIRDELLTKSYDEVRATYYLDTILKYRLLPQEKLQQKVYLALLNNWSNLGIQADAPKLFESQLIDLPLLEAIRNKNQLEIRRLCVNGLQAG